MICNTTIRAYKFQAQSWAKGTPPPTATLYWSSFHNALHGTLSQSFLRIIKSNTLQALSIPAKTQTYWPHPFQSWNCQLCPYLCHTHSHLWLSVVPVVQPTKYPHPYAVTPQTCLCHMLHQTFSLICQPDQKPAHNLPQYPTSSWLQSRHTNSSPLQFQRPLHKQLHNNSPPTENRQILAKQTLKLEAHSRGV